jgi:hypothetical protein
MQKEHIELATAGIILLGALVGLGAALVGYWTAKANTSSQNIASPMSGSSQRQTFIVGLLAGVVIGMLMVLVLLRGHQPETKARQPEDKQETIAAATNRPHGIQLVSIEGGLVFSDEIMKTIVRPNPKTITMQYVEKCSLGIREIGGQNRRAEIITKKMAVPREDGVLIQKDIPIGYRYTTLYDTLEGDMWLVHDTKQYKPSEAHAIPPFDGTRYVE